MTISSSDLSMNREALLTELHGVLPTFWEVRTENTETILRGPVPVTDSSGGEFDAFAIELRVSHRFPEVIPVVFEVGGRVPRDASRHVNERDGSCCIELPFEFHRRRPQLSVAEYILGPVRSYFLAQLHFEQFGSWPAGERGHGFEGVREAIVELFGIDDVDLLLALLSTVVHWRKTKHDACPCGSGSRLYACHGKRVRAEIRDWPRPALNCLVVMLLDEQKRRKSNRRTVAA